MARGVFHHGTSLGFNFTLLDIGGGFPGDSTSTALFTEMARSINVSLKECFADVKDLAVVAEPGRFFATSTHTLAVCVTSKKEELIDGEKVCVCVCVCVCVMYVCPLSVGVQVLCE